MADLQTFWATDFWAAGFWADDFWAGGVAPPPAVTPSTAGGGGRREWDDVFPRQRTRRRATKDTRPLTKAERRELDALFRSRVSDTVRTAIRNEPAVRQAVRAALAVPIPEPPAPQAELAHRAPLSAKSPARGPVRSLEDVQREAQERERIAAEQEQQRQQAVQMVLAAVEQAEHARVEAERMEQERLAAEENEMLEILMMVHEGQI